jgi:hypothetical protein
VVEWRPSHQRWHVTLPDIRFELAPVFDCWATAAEIAGKYQDGHAFCADIPLVPIGDPYPRPNRMQPARTIDLTRFYPQDRAGLVRLAEEAGS